MTNDIKGTSVVFLCARHVLLCGGPMYEGISDLMKHSHLDQSLMKGFMSSSYFVILRIHIHINGSTPILILCFRFFCHSSFTFALHTSGILALDVLIIDLLYQEN